MFLLVPAHPGFPGQIPQSRKTVVCVCDAISPGLPGTIPLSHSTSVIVQNLIQSLFSLLCSLYGPSECTFFCTTRIIGHSGIKVQGEGCISV